MYLELAKIWEKADFKRKQGCFLVLSNEYFLQEQSQDGTPKENPYILESYKTALDCAYGVKLKNFEIDIENDHERLIKMSNDIWSWPKGLLPFTKNRSTIYVQA